MPLHSARVFVLPFSLSGFKMTDFLKWLGTVSSIIGSFVVAFGYMLPGYSLFMLGSISWLVVARIFRDKPLATLNAFFFMANIVGFYRAI